MRTLGIALLLALPLMAGAQTFAEPAFADTVFKAEVVEASGLETRVVEGTDLREDVQTVTVRLLEGARAGETLTLENGTAIELSKGDRVYMHRTPGIEGGEEQWAVGEPDRSLVLIALTVLFVLVTLLVAGVSGARSLAALIASFALIIFALVPALSLGLPPVATSIGLGVVILAVSMFMTHGLNRETWVALLGSVIALAFAAFLAQFSVELAKLSGFASDEAVFLNFATDGALDLPGLLLAGILVGIIGVLNDVSVSQVHTVAELYRANPTLTRGEILRRSLKVGREHMGAVVNTLPLAYAGVSLPLLLLFSQSDAPFSFIVNREMFAAEVIRALAGSIGLMLSGMIATLIAVYTVVPRAIIPINK